jgi:peptidylprolyl isomerase
MNVITYSFLTFASCLLHCLTPLQAMEATMPKHPIAIIETNQGTIEVSLKNDVAPKATENFIKHAKDGYYNGVIFHRVIPGFMVQGGDPTGTGRGGESIWKAPFEDEVTDGEKFDAPGKLAMANAGPKTNGSQFFITTAATPWLNKKHTIFGEVIKGYDVVQKIEKTKTGAADRPVEEQKIISITIQEPAKK